MSKNNFRIFFKLWFAFVALMMVATMVFVGLVVFKVLNGDLRLPFLRIQIEQHP